MSMEFSRMRGPRGAWRLPVGMALAVWTAAAVLPSAGAQTSGSESVDAAIVDPTSVMAHYYARLRNAARGRAGSIARAMVYGESTIAADRVTSTLRQNLQRRFGDAGKGWVPMAPGWRYQRHRDVQWSNEGPWQTWVVNRGNGPLDRYGLGGVIASNRSRHARAYFGTANRGSTGRKVSRYQLFYQSWPEGGDVALSVDDGAADLVSTHSAQVTDQVYELQLEDGQHMLEVRPERGDLRLYGVVMERDRPGAVVDALMLVGAFTRVLLHFDEDHWQRQIELRQPDLMVFWVGGNDAVVTNVGFAPSQYIEQYREAIGRARQGRPEASCLVVSVLDSGEEIDGRVRTRRRVPRLVQAQREVARRSGCAFFDVFEATGGHGTMARWVRASPRLAEADMTHLTRTGAQQVGNLLYRALMQGYEAWLAGPGA